MPTYDYKCAATGHFFTLRQEITAEKLVECPEHPGFGVDRLIGSGGGVIFKGTGFYQTDYKTQRKSES